MSGAAEPVSGADDAMGTAGPRREQAETVSSSLEGVRWWDDLDDYPRISEADAGMAHVNTARMVTSNNLAPTESPVAQTLRARLLALSRR